VSSLIIVESHNDQYFIEGLSAFLNITPKINPPICQIDDFECLNGLSEKKLFECLNEIKFEKYQKIGIIIDADNEGVQKRVELINRALEKFDDNLKLDGVNQVKKSDKLDIKFACYIMNVNGNGELETLLKKIKSKDSTYADCLEAWRKCLQENDKKVKDKTFDKFWVDIYQRYDNCKENESKADENCKGEKSLKKDIWDFENPLVDELKEFLRLFS